MVGCRLTVLVVVIAIMRVVVQSRYTISLDQRMYLCGHNFTRVFNRLVGAYVSVSWLRGTVVECRFLTGELSLSCARRAADG